MAVSIKILLGFILGLAGTIHIADDPVTGCGVILAGGLLVMDAVNRFV